MIARAVLVSDVNDAFAGLLIDERMWMSERGARMLRLYVALDALRAASPYPLSLDALD